MTESKKEWWEQKNRQDEERFNRIEDRLDSLCRAVEKLVAVKQKEIEARQPEETFEDICKQIERDRLREEERKEVDLEYVAEQEYTMFRCWCNGYRATCYPGTHTINFDEMQKSVYNNATFFKEYCETEKKDGFGRKVSDERIKKYLAEKYFGYEYYRDEHGNQRARKKVG